MLRKLVAVSIIALICVSLTSAYIGNSSNATNATTNNTIMFHARMQKILITPVIIQLTTR
ncbi:MAG: hypothetical protein MW690_000367 [Methanophagales archaeon]|nr:hypothetical protein [Methanophagales archaeon]